MRWGGPEVAERVDRHVSATGASVLVVAGDPRSRSRLVDALGEGVAAVLAALRAEAVDTLLLDAGVTREATVWISDAPGQVAESADDLRAAGSEPSGEAPVDAALLRAAAGTGAAFVAIGGGRTGPVGRPLDDGVGALLRYPLPTGA
nr:hypothetical protein [Pseudonocardia sp. MH-G8]